MFRHAACLGLLVALGGCTDRILLRDVWDAALPEPDVGVDRAPVPIVDAECRFSQRLSFKSQAAQLLILLDRSSAMQAAFYGSSSRAAAVQSVLLKHMEDHQSHIKLGWEEFPDLDSRFSSCYRTSCCAGSVVAPQYYGLRYLQNYGYLECSDPACLSGSSDSPSHKALGQARDYFKQDKSKDDDRYALLITASEPSCSGDAGPSDACPAATEAATELVVNLEIPLAIVTVGYQPSGSSCLVSLSNLRSKVGIPGDLSSLTPATSLQMLDDAVSHLFDEIAKTTCTITTTDPVPKDANLSVWLRYNTQVPKVECSASDGWCFPGAGRNQIMLLGSYCDQYLDMPPASTHDQFDVYVEYPSCTPQP
jgi:hypothetical protein